MTDAATDTHTLVVERVMPHPPEKIWRALTQAALIEEWLMQNDFEPVVGHRFNFRSRPNANWNGVVDCEVVAVEPNQRLSYTWNVSGEEEGGTHLRMEQSGFRLQDKGNYQGANYGWQKFLASLERVAAGLT